MRNISAALTTEQIIESVRLVREGKPPLKDVTRRLGWEYLKVGERLQVCKKVQGRKPGEPLEKIAVIEVVSVRREPLRKMIDDLNYGRKEVKREGFRTGKDFGHEYNPLLTATADNFVEFFCKTHKWLGKPIVPEHVITRIEFKYVIPITFVVGAHYDFLKWQKQNRIAPQFLIHLSRLEQIVSTRAGADFSEHLIVLGKLPGSTGLSFEDTVHTLRARGYKMCNGEVLP